MSSMVCSSQLFSLYCRQIQSHILQSSCEDKATSTAVVAKCHEVLRRRQVIAVPVTLLEGASVDVVINLIYKGFAMIYQKFSSARKLLLVSEMACTESEQRSDYSGNLFYPVDVEPISAIWYSVYLWKKALCAESRGVFSILLSELGIMHEVAVVKSVIEEEDL